jgi:hypothetical protein
MTHINAQLLNSSKRASYGQSKLLLLGTSPPPPVVAISAESPYNLATFIVNSEPRTGARPSVRLCVGLIKQSLAGNVVKRQKNG